MFNRFLGGVNNSVIPCHETYNMTILFFNFIFIPGAEG